MSTGNLFKFLSRESCFIGFLWVLYSKGKQHTPQNYCAALELWSADCWCLGSTVCCTYCTVLYCTVLYCTVLYCTLFREHHLKFPNHFIKPYRGYMQPWVTEMQRRKTLRDKLRKRKEEAPKNYPDTLPSPMRKTEKRLSSRSRSPSRERWVTNPESRSHRINLCLIYIWCILLNS